MAITLWAWPKLCSLLHSAFQHVCRLIQILYHPQTQLLTMSVSKRKSSSHGTAHETRYLQTNAWQYNGFTHLYTQSMIQTHWCALVKPINCLICEWTLCLHLPVVNQFPDSEVTFNCRGKHFSLDPQTLSTVYCEGVVTLAVTFGWFERMWSWRGVATSGGGLPQSEQRCNPTDV